MGAEDNGLTLEGLAHRLEALQHENAENAERLETLERENERMRSENAELREEVAPLRSSGTRWEEVVALRGSTTRQVAKPAAESDGQVSRRALIRKAGAAAVAAVAAGTLLNPHE